MSAFWWGLGAYLANALIGGFVWIVVLDHADQRNYKWLMSNRDWRSMLTIQCWPVGLWLAWWRKGP